MERSKFLKSKIGKPVKFSVGSQVQEGVLKEVEDEFLGIATFERTHNGYCKIKNIHKTTNIWVHYSMVVISEKTIDVLL